MKKAKLILSTIVLTSLCSGFLGTGTVDASEHARNTYNNKVVSLLAASDPTLAMTHTEPDPYLWNELFMETYAPSNAAQRWVMEYNENSGGYYIREETPLFSSRPFYLVYSGGWFINPNLSKGDEGSLWQFIPAGNAYFVRNMARDEYLTWHLGGSGLLDVGVTAFNWDREQRFTVQVVGEV